MFKVEIFVTDKKLASALLALDKVGHDLKVVPVRNVAVRNGQLQEAGHPTTGSELVSQYLHRVPKGTTFRRQEVIAQGDSYGVSKPAVIGGLIQAVNNGLIQRTSKRGTYKVR